MKKTKLTRIFLCLLGAAAVASACADHDGPHKNPSLHRTPEAGSPGAGEPAVDVTAGGASAAGSAGMATTDEGGAAGAGQAAETAPYDCVLHPKTHLEIINACTSAQRVEKHPVLPKIP